MWHTLESYYDRSAPERETVNAVLHGETDAQVIDAKDITFQVRVHVILLCRKRIIVAVKRKSCFIEFEGGTHHCIAKQK